MEIAIQSNFTFMSIVFFLNKRHIHFMIDVNCHQPVNKISKALPNMSFTFLPKFVYQVFQIPWKNKEKCFYFAGCIFHYNALIL